MKKTKMILLDKFIDNAIDVDDYLLVGDLQDFVGVPKFIFTGGEYIQDGLVGTISIDEETETISIDGEISFYDDFDFDFLFNDEDEIWEAEAVYVLDVDPAAADEPVDPEDPEEPSVDSVTFSPTSGTVVLGADETFKYTIAVEGTGVALLEIDINTVDASAPWPSREQFWLAADVNDPYAGDKADFDQNGVVVDYADNTWTIDFGDIATPAMIESGAISIHTAVTDIDKNPLWNDMMNPLPEGKVTVNITREEPGDEDPEDTEPGEPEDP